MTKVYIASNNLPVEFFFYPPHPRGVSIVKNLSRRTAPKFGTHVRIDTLTLKKKLTHPTPGGFRGLSIVKNLSRRTAPKFGTRVRIDTLTLKKMLTHPRGEFRGLSIVKNLSQRTAPKFGTHVRIYIYIYSRNKRLHMDCRYVTHSLTNVQACMPSLKLCMWSKTFTRLHQQCFRKSYGPTFGHFVTFTREAKLQF